MIDHDEAVRRLRRATTTLQFESPSRGDVCLQRLSYALPASESKHGTPAQIAMMIIRRTIQHSHRTHSGLDQHGNGAWVMFSRHVTESDRRWDFEVDVAIERDGATKITDARVVRPDDEIDEDSEPRAPLTDDELVPHGMIACPCCGHATLTERAGYEICPVCFWEDDGQDDGNAGAVLGGPNRGSLTEARKNYLAYGACDERSREAVRRPTREEVQLRGF